jgi:hypothetical protein
MTLDLTAQVAPVIWMMIVLMVVSGVSVLLSHN